MQISLTKNRKREEDCIRFKRKVTERFEELKKRSKERYWYFKNKGICVQCEINKTSGKILCKECKLRTKKSYDKRKVRYKKQIPK